MPSRITRILLSLAIVSTMAWSRPARADAMREFVLSCTYGTLAGTLAGAAMLAFTSSPSNNLNDVARGASLGLYAGILLGTWVVFGVQDGQDDENPPASQTAFLKPRFGVFPLISQRGLEGASAQFEVLRF